MVLLDAFRFIGGHLGLLLSKTGEHLLLSAAALGIALVISVVSGSWLGHRHRGSFLAINLANVLRALPELAVIAILISAVGLGFLNPMLALLVVGVPPILTNAYTAVDQVDRDTVDAAVGTGMTPLQVFRRIELPLALPLLFAGVKTAAVYIVATATLATYAGGGGLGDIISNQASYGFAGVFGAALWVSALAFLTKLAFAGLQRAMTPRGLRHAVDTTVAGPAVPTVAGRPRPAEQTA